MENHELFYERLEKMNIITNMYDDSRNQIKDVAKIFNMTSYAVGKTTRLNNYERGKKKVCENIESLKEEGKIIKPIIRDENLAFLDKHDLDEMKKAQKKYYEKFSDK